MYFILHYSMICRLVPYRVAICFRKKRKTIYDPYQKSTFFDMDIFET